MEFAFYACNFGQFQFTFKLFSQGGGFLIQALIGVCSQIVITVMEGCSVQTLKTNKEIRR